MTIYAIVNERDEVAVKFQTTTPHNMRIGKNEYFFGVKANVCMAWIKQEDVTAILQLRKICCGGTNYRKYVLATQSEVDKWT